MRELGPFEKKTSAWNLWDIQSWHIYDVDLNIRFPNPAGDLIMEDTWTL
jgi:hypothetical protein